MIRRRLLVALLGPLLGALLGGLCLAPSGVARAEAPADPASLVRLAENRRAADALRALREMARAQAWLFATLPERRITGLVSVLVHRWSRAVERAFPPGVGPLFGPERASWKYAADTLRRFLPTTRADTARVLERFGLKAKFFGLYRGLDRAFTEVMDHVAAVARGSEKYEEGHVRGLIERWRGPLTDSVERFCKSVEPLGLELVRAAFYEIVLYIGADPEPRA